MSGIWAPASRVVWCASACLLLAACGGGGGSPGNESSGTPLPDKLGLSAPAQGEAGVALNFHSSVAAASDLSFDWSFGDGSVGQGSSASHVFSNAGEFDVVLKITNGAKQTREETTRITINRTAGLKNLSCTGGDGRGWCWLSPDKSGNVINAVQFVDAQTGWAVGEYGEIRHSGDGGATWLPQASATTVALQAVVFKNALEGWALGSDGSLVRTTNGGAHWSSLPSQPAKLLTDRSSDFRLFHLNLLAGQALRYTEGKSCGHSSCPAHFISTDGGLNWTAGSQPFGDWSPSGVIWRSDNIRFGGNWQRSIDNGLRWTTIWPHVPPGFDQLNVFDDRTAVLLSPGIDIDFQPQVGGLRVYVTQDGGLSWSELAPLGLPQSGRFDGSARAISGSTGLYVFVADVAYLSHDLGRSWTRAAAVPEGSRDGYTSVFSAFKLVPGGGVYFRGLSNSVWMAADYGGPWTKLADAGNGVFPFPIAQPSPGTLIGSTGSSTFLRSTDFGKSWAQIISAGRPNPSEIRAFASPGPNRLLKFDDSNRLSLSVDNSLSWTQKADAEPIDGASLQFVNATTGWFLGGSGSLYRTSDSGDSWQQLTSPARQPLVRVEFVDPLHGWALDRSLRLLSSADGGLSWSVVAANGLFQPQGPNDKNARIRFLNTSNGVALISAGRARVTQDGGKTWHDRPTGLSYGSYDYFRALEKSDATTLWALGPVGELITSTDSGETWNAVAGLPAPANGWRAIQFRNKLTGWLVGDSGRIAVTRDGGKTWQTQASGTTRNLTGLSFADDRTAWITAEGGVLLSTGTGGF